jgi:hypothetical protein
VVRVDTQKPGGGNYSYAAGDFYVELQVDTTVYVATTYNASFLPPVNRLVQMTRTWVITMMNSGYIGKLFHGSHTLVARAHLNPQTQPANSSSAIITVPATVAGPTITLVSPTTEQL